MAAGMTHQDNEKVLKQINLNSFISALNNQGEISVTEGSDVFVFLALDGRVTKGE